MRSDSVKRGLERAPHRSLLWALGKTDEEMERPFIGVISSYSEIVPGHINLRTIADAVTTVWKTQRGVFSGHSARV